MTWLTARELIGLPGMANSKAGNRMRLERLGVPSRQRPGREGGGGQEYDTSKLPAETRRALTARAIAQVPVPEPAHTPVPSPVKTEAVTVGQRKPPSDADRTCADARTSLVNLVRDLAELHGSKKAAALLALQFASGQATAALTALADQACQRKRGGAAAMSARTLERWMSLHRAQGWWGLLPAVAEPTTPVVDEDVAAVLGLYMTRNAQYRNLTAAAKAVTKQLGRDYDTWPALCSRARRVLPKIDTVTLIKARHSGSERAALLPFKRRDTTVLKPLDVAVGDGHSWKGKVRHPDHGAPFTPEVTVVLDAATRMATGWSTSLSENCIAVGDALRHAVGNHGVPAVFYSDNGAGQTGKMIDAPITGLMDRLGCEHRTGIPGHPQGRGLIERSWQTHLINAARQFGSYTGGDVDGGTYRKAAAELAKEQRAIRRATVAPGVLKLSPKAPSWKQFIAAVDKALHEYNTEHRHRSLPKHESGPHAGKHMTPAEAWAAHLDPARQIKLSPLDLRMMFMPAVLRTAQRGEVTFLNQTYSAPELMGREVNGRPVSVRYDLFDPSFVLVFTTGGEFVCEAKFEANRIDYMPKAVIEIGREKRVKAMIKRRDQKVDTALRELSGRPLSLPEPGTPMVFNGPTAEALIVSSTCTSSAGDAATAASGRPFFNAPSDRYEWLMTHRGEWGSEDTAWLAAYVRGEDYEALADYYVGRGLGWGEAPAEGFRGAR